MDGSCVLSVSLGLWNRPSDTRPDDKMVIWSPYQMHHEIGNSRAARLFLSFWLRFVQYYEIVDSRTFFSQVPHHVQYYKIGGIRAFLRC